MQKIGTIVWVGLEIGVQNPDFAGVGFCFALLSRATGPYPARHKTTCARLTTQWREWVVMQARFIQRLQSYKQRSICILNCTWT